MDKYLINENTLVILPYENNKSKVIEKYITYVVDNLPINIINESCLYYGSSLKGRCESSEYMIGIKYKCPIIISEVKEIIFFPTTSVKNDDCVWFNYTSISKYFQNGKHLFVSLVNNNDIKIEISNYAFSNQVLKSSRLDSILKSKYR